MKLKKRNERNRLKQKYELISKDSHPNVQNCVKNLSDRVLTDDELKVLNRGKNFATQSKKKDQLKFIATCEVAVENMKDVTIQEKTAIK